MRSYVVLLLACNVGILSHELVPKGLESRLALSSRRPLSSPLGRTLSLNPNDPPRVPPFHEFIFPF